MRLTRLVMEGFRSYREPVEVRFEPGANVFLGRNEAGKTGILLAVQAALYPPRSGADREALVSEGCGVCRVGLEYLLPDGRTIRVDRDLISHRGSIAELRSDGPHVLATALGDIAQIVREHTGCDEALFRATLLVRHEGVEIGDADDLTRSLTERIEVLVSGSPGGVSAARAVRKLDERLKGLAGPRAGEIVAAQTRLREAQAQLASAQSRAQRLEDGRPRLDELSRRQEQLEAEQRDAEVLLERARRAAQLDARRTALQSERAGIDRTLDARAEVARLAEQVERAQGRGGDPVPRPAGRLLVFGLAGLLLLGGLAAILLGQNAAAAALTTAAAGAAGAGWWLGRAPTAPPATALPAVQPVPAGMAGSEDLQAERARLGRDLDEVEAEIRRAAIHRLEPAALARLEMRAEQLPALIRSAADARIRVEVELAQLEAAGLPLAELEDEVAVAGRQVDRLQLRLAAMRIAREELAAAIQDIRHAVGPDLAAAASRLLGEIAPGLSVALNQGAGLRFLPAGPGGEELGRRQLSDGTLDQFHFAVRVALAAVLLGDLRPPLLLDDPFRYADAGRRESLHLMLESIAAERQVLYFTVEDPAPLAVTHRLPVVASPVGSE